MIKLFKVYTCFYSPVVASCSSRWLTRCPGTISGLLQATFREKSAFWQRCSTPQSNPDGTDKDLSTYPKIRSASLKFNVLLLTCNISSRTRPVFDVFLLKSSLKSLLHNTLHIRICKHCVMLTLTD